MVAPADLEQEVLKGEAFQIGIEKIAPL